MNNSAGLRRQILSACRRLEVSGLNRGTTGNISCREEDHFLVTPSGVPVDAMTETGVVAMRFDGTVIGRPVNGIFIATYCSSVPTYTQSSIRIRPMQPRWPACVKTCHRFTT